MSITTYTELKTALQNWYARSDETFTNRVDEFIDLAEDRIHYGAGEPGEPTFTQPLRIRGMETSANLTVSSQTVALPTGFLQERRLYLNTDPKTDLDYFPPDRFWATDAAVPSASGQPSIYTIEGTNIIFGPSPDTSYTGKILYFGKLDALSESATTNWLVTNAPTIYLYACLLEAAIWDRNDEEALKYAGLFRGRINSLVRQDKLSRYGGGSLSMRPDKVA